MKLRTFTWNVCGLDVEHLEAKDVERLDRILAQLTATDADGEPVREEHRGYEDSVLSGVQSIGKSESVE